MANKIEQTVAKKLSIWIRTRASIGVEPTVNTSTLIEAVKDFPAYTVSEKLMLLLSAIERMTGHPGAQVLLTPEWDFALAWAENESELKYLLTSLMERKLIVPANLRSANFSNLVFECSITPQGWDLLSDRSKAGVISKQAFVAMAFATEMTPAWHSMRDALSSIGYEPYRVDAKPHLERIDMKIMAEIRNSRFVVADVTLQRPGVYFEAGFALGLGIPVFWCVRENDADKVHFDTRQYNHIRWKDENDLAARLTEFVVAIVGPGAKK